MQKTLKSLVLVALIIAGMFMPMTTNAQNDSFFRSGNNVYNNRADEGLSNETFGGDTFGPTVPTNITAPLGNGLLIMMVAGAGYAVARRRRARKGMTLLLAAAMLLGMTQCKKHVDTISSVDTNKVFITLDLGSGSRHSVNTTTGEVTYAAGDKIHVGCNGAYVGTLTHDGTQFSGDITGPTVGEYLYFYFVSGLLDENEMSAATQSYTVSISDQRTQLPVLSVGVSTNPYEAGVTSYTSRLRNKCALLEFRLQEGATDELVQLCNFQSVAKIDFANNTITPTGEKDAIKLHNLEGTASVSRWAILMPESHEDWWNWHELAKVGDKYEMCAFITEIEPNALGAYFASIRPVMYNYMHGYTVNNNGKAIMLSGGNLVYSNNSWAENKWHIASDPWTCVGQDNAQITNPNYMGNLDLFGWGVWGEGGAPTTATTDNSDYVWTGDINVGHYEGLFGWRTPTKDELNYILNGRSVAKRYLCVQVENRNGYLLFPDDFTDKNSVLAHVTEYNDQQEPASAWILTGEQIKQLWTEEGVAFLPCADSRVGTSMTGDNYGGYYWTSTPDGSSEAWFLGFCHGNNMPLGVYSADRYNGYSVRLVR